MARNCVEKTNTETLQVSHPKISPGFLATVLVTVDSQTVSPSDSEGGAGTIGDLLCLTSALMVPSAG